MSCDCASPFVPLLSCEGSDCHLHRFSRYWLRDGYCRSFLVGLLNCLGDCGCFFVLGHAMVIRPIRLVLHDHRLLAGLQCLPASRGAILVYRSFLVGLLFIFCSAKLVRWADLIVFWLTIAFFCDCDAPASLNLLALFAKLFVSFVFLLVVVVTRHHLLSCSVETALISLAILIRSSLILLNAFVIFLGWWLSCDSTLLAVVVRVLLPRSDGWSQ